MGVCLAAGLLAACGDAEVAPPPPRPVIVQSIDVPTTVQRELQYAARVEAGTGTQLSFLVQGRLQRVHVADGERVRAGQLLAELDDTDYRVDQRQAVVAERTAAADLARRRELEAEGILSPAAVDMAEAEFASVRAQRQAADRQVAHTRLLAPYDGRMGRRLLDPGTVVPAGEPVLAMQDVGHLDVVVDIPERDALRLRFDESMHASGRLAGAPQAPPIELAYREHTTMPDEQSRTYRLVLRGVATEGVHPLPGMAVRVTISDPDPATIPDGQARVPLAAVLSDAAGDSVLWVADEGRARRLPVRLIEVGDGWALVEGALPPDLPVVVAGARQLSDGQSVSPRHRK